jgi:sporulation integral membrane protein YtvI
LFLGEAFFMEAGKPKSYLLYLAALALGLLAIPYAVPILFPFALGAGLALGAEPTVGFLSRKCHVPRWAAAGLGVTGLFALMLSLAVLMIAVLARQLSRLSGLLPQVADSLSMGLSALKAHLLRLSQGLPDGVSQVVRQGTEELFSGSSALVQKVAGQVPQLASGLMGILSRWALVLFTTILSGYMISARLPALRQWYHKKLPAVWKESYFPALKGMRRALGGWLLAQGKLMGITFLLLSGAFLLLRIPNTFLYAGLITLVDAFPILGTGTVLIPWSILCLLQGNSVLGVGLLAVYGVVWLARSVLEPKIIGKELGLDPLVTLLSIYAGFRLLGLGGMLIAPIIAMIVTQAVKYRH